MLRWTNLNNIKQRQRYRNAFIEELLDKSFGSDSNCIVYSAQKPQSLVTSSSIEWKGIKFMFENKKVQKTVQKPEVSKPEVDKAVRDFEENQDCDVLLAFVSEDSKYRQSQASFWHYTYEDGRPTGHLDRRILS